MRTKTSHRSTEKLARQCAAMIQEAQRAVALTGAGISTGAGIPDFRGPQGLYASGRYNPDTIFDIRYFRRHPEAFYDFTRDFIALEEKARPTATHSFLSRLEQAGKLAGVITQNIDGLHQKAGSRNVLELHGGIGESRCLSCGEIFAYGLMKTKLRQAGVPVCACGGLIKPDIVFFGEDVKHFMEASRLALAADLFFVIGTSCSVYPAAALPAFVSGRIIVVNNAPAPLDSGNVVLSVAADIDKFFLSVEQQASWMVHSVK